MCFTLRGCVCAMLFAAPVLYASLLVNLVTRINEYSAASAALLPIRTRDLLRHKPKAAESQLVGKAVPSPSPAALSGMSQREGLPPQMACRFPQYPISYGCW